MIPASAVAEDVKRKEESKDLEPLIVSALRSPREASTVTSSVTRLDPESLTADGVDQLRQALSRSPGVISTSTSGNTGAPSSVFIRGTNTMHTQLVMDGIRIGDSNAFPNNIMSSVRIHDIGNLEVLRGPQGAIFGGESSGGVVWMETPRGAGIPRSSVFGEAGSFGSMAAHGTYQGEVDGKLGYFLSGGWEATDNDGVSQRFNLTSGALRVEAKVSDVWTLGTTYRGADFYYENRKSPEVDDRFDLATVYAEGRISDAWTARFRIGGVRDLYDTTRNGFTSSVDSEATILTTDHEVRISDSLRLLAGAFANLNRYENGVFDETGDRYGVHSVLEWEIIDNLTGMASLRWEDYDYFGDALTWRTGAAYEVPGTGTLVRSGVGSSFRAPNYLEYYGNPGWFISSNPDLKEETSIGWDIGVEQEIGKDHKVAVTWFHNKFQDRIDYTSDPVTWQGQYVNLDGDSVTEGLELALRGGCLVANRLSYQIAWTWLNKSLSDHPENTVNAGLDFQATDRLLLGVGVNYLSSHSWGNDPANYKEIDGYAVARLHASYQLTEHVRLHGRVENLLDRDYLLSDIYGSRYEGAGIGAYAGLTVEW